MNYAFLMLILPLLTGVILIAGNNKISPRIANVLLSVGLAAGFLVGMLSAVDFYAPVDFQAGSYLHQQLFSWLHSVKLVKSDAVFFGLRLDALSWSFTLVVLAAAWLCSIYMAWVFQLESHHRDQNDNAITQAPTGLWYGTVSLLVTSVMLIILADSLLLLLVGWTGTSMCSLLLLYAFTDGEKQANLTEVSQHQAIESSDVVVSRSKPTLPVGVIWLFVGDICLMVAMVFLYYRVGTVDISHMVARLPELYPLLTQAQMADSSYAASISLPVRLMVAILIVGLCAKAALIPFASWITTAVDGVMPARIVRAISKLQMAGLLWVVCLAMLVPVAYVAARFYSVIAVVDSLRIFMSVIGVVSAILFGLTALTKTRLLQVSLYVSLSQFGLALVMLSANAWHAATVSILFLVVVLVLFWLVTLCLVSINGHDDLRQMRQSPASMKIIYVSSWVVVVGLCALPWLSGRFLSQQAILWELWLSQSYVLYAAILVAYFIMAVVMGRLMYLLFHFSQQPTAQPQHEVNAQLNHMTLYAPLLILLVLASPLLVWLIPSFSQVLPLSSGQLALIYQSEVTPLYTAVINAHVAMVIIGLAGVWHYYHHVHAMYRSEHGWSSRQQASESAYEDTQLAAYPLAKWQKTKLGRYVRHWLSQQYGINAAYQTVLYTPYAKLTQWMADDPLAWLANKLSTMTNAFVSHSKRLQVPAWCKHDLSDGLSVMAVLCGVLVLMLLI